MNVGLRRTRSTCVLAFVFLSSGCTTTQYLGDEDRRKISVVRINSNVQKPPVMSYLGSGIGAFFGSGSIGAVGAFPGIGLGAIAAIAALSVIGEAVANKSSLKAGKELQDSAEKNGIFIEQIAFQEIDAAIRQSGQLNVTDSEDATAPIVNVTVYQYGFSTPHGFSSNLVPVVAIRCEMVDATGKVIWSARDNVVSLGNPAAPMSLEAMLDDPKRIETAWRQASRRIAGNIAKGLLTTQQ